jgi:gliding motility-associated-like protein
MKKAINKLLLILLIAFSQPVLSQIDTVFWFAAPWVTTGHANNIPVVMRLSSFNNLTTVRVRQPASTFDTTFTIPANSLVSESLSHLVNQIENTPANTVHNRGLKITSDFPITVIYEVVTNVNNPETYSLKGQNGMGLEFVCPFQTRSTNGPYSPAPKSQIDIVATQNATVIWITPKCNVVGHAANITYSVSLNAGQSYAVENITQAANVPGQNLSGTIVVSNKPISVSVSDDSVHGVSGCYDLMGDQIVPVEVVGMEYIINKGGLNAGENEGTYIVATQNFTQLTINDGVVSTALLNKGDTYYYPIAQALTYITADKPVYVIHASGFGCEMGEAIIPPLNCAGSDQVSFTRTNGQTFILNILCKTTAIGNFSLNGNTTIIPAASFTTVPGTGGVWSGFQKSFTTAEIATGFTNLLSNNHPTDKLFAMGVINGGGSRGCINHYMSSFLRKVYVNAGIDKNLCTETTTVSLTGTVDGGTTTGIWTTTNGTGTFGSATGLNTTYTLSTNDLNQSQINFILSSTGNCTPIRDTMTVNIFKSPIVDAGNGMTLCKNNITSIPLSGSLQLAAGANWTSSGTGSFGNPGALNTTYIPSPADLGLDSIKISLTSTGSLNGCPNRKDSLTIHFTKAPVVTPGADVSVCANNATVAISGSVTAGAATGIWSGGAGSLSPGGAALSQTYTPGTNDITAGSVYLVLASTNNGNCKQVKDSILITFTNAPAVNAGSDLSACVNNPTTLLSGTVGGPTTTGMWAGGTGTFSPNNTVLNSLYTPTAAEIAAGFVKLVLNSTNNGNCNITRDTVLINFTNAPTVNAGTDLSACKNNAGAVLSGLVNGPTTTGVWSGGAGTYSPSTAALNATYTPTPSELSAGSVTLTLTSSNNGNCNQVTDNVLINFTNAPVVSAGADLYPCANNAVTVLTGTVSGPTTTGSWSGGSGTFNPGNSVLSTSYTPSVADLAAGSVTLVLTSTNNGNCNQEKDSVYITFTTAPSVDAGAALFSCANNPATVISGTIGGPTTTGVWSGGAGSFNPNNASLNSIYTPSPSEVAAGSVYLTLSSTNNLNCNQEKDSVLITFTGAPLVNAGSNLVACNNNLGTELAGTVSGPTTTGIWSGGSGSYNPGSSVLNATYTPSASELSAGSATLVLTSSNNGTCNQVRDTVLITFTNGPLVDAGVDLYACKNNITTELAGLVTGPTTTGIWNGGNGTFNPGNAVLNATYTPSAAEVAAGSVTLTLTSTNNGSCNLEKDSVIINFTNAPQVNAGIDMTACANNAAIALSGNVNGPTTTGVWSGGAGTYNPDNTGLNSIYTPSASEIAAGFVTLTLSSSNNGSCNLEKDSVMITFSAAPVVSAGADLTACKNNATTVLSGLVGGPTTTGVWLNGTGTFAPANSVLNATYTPSAAELTAGFVKLVLGSTNNANCNQETDTVMIVFTGSPLVDVGPDVSVCANNATVAINGSVTIGATTGVWSSPNGSGLFSPSASSLNTIYQLSPADVAQGSIVIKLTSTNNGTCKAENDSLIINVTPKPNVNAGINDTICSSNIFYGISGSVSGGASSGVWSTMGNGTFGNNSNLSTIYTLGQADTLAGHVNLVLTSTGGNCLPETDTVLVVIAKAPLVVAGPDNTVCDNQQVLLNGNVVGLTTTGAWSSLGTGYFTPDDSLLTTYYQPSPLDVSTGFVKLVLTSINNKGCAAVKDTINLSFKPSPVSDFNTNNVCAQKTATFTDISTSSAGPITGWHWDFGDLTTSTVNNPTHAYTNPGTYTVAHVAYSANGCNDTIRKTIEVYFLPQAQFYQNTPCVGNATQFVDSTKSLSGSIVSWNWNFGDSQYATIQNPQHPFSSATNYTVTLVATSAFGCKDTIQKVVTVISGPDADFSINPNPVEALEVANFTDLSTGSAALTNWYWAFGDSTASNLQNPSHSYNGQGDFSVLLVVKDLNGCIDTVRKDISVVLLPDVPTAFTPNGDGQNDIFFVRGGPFKSLNVRIYNNWGQLIFESNDQLQGWNGTFNGTEQPIGVFVWVVEVEMLNGKKIKKTGDVTLLR